MTEFKKRIYQDEDRRKFYQKSFCVYFDILGFSDKIKTNDLDFFNKYLNVLDEEIRYLNDQHDVGGTQGFKKFELKIFTDNFVIGYPWSDEFGEPELGDIFDLISHLQVSLARSDIFVRGAIALSDLYMDESIVIGRALLEAYNLEKEAAIFPRIILSEDVLRAVKRQITCYRDKESSPQNSNFLIDVDNRAFLNYLKSIVLKHSDEPEKVFELLLEHKKVVVDNLNKNSNNYKLYGKYQWVADYHNHFCKHGLPEIDSKKIKRLLIDKAIARKKIITIF